MKIVITGAGGFFAWEFIRQLVNKDEHEIVAISSNPEKTRKYLCFENIEMVSNDEILSGEYSLNGVDIIVHSAFCRKSDGELLIDSLNFLYEIVTLAIKADIKGFINLSSQSVYGSKEGVRPAEDGKMNPGYLYALAKCSSELILRNIVQASSSDMAYTNIRLASLMGPSYFVPQNVLYKFICSGINGEAFKVVGGKQQFSFIDVRDAARAVLLLLNVPVSNWNDVYNLGPERQTNIVEMADIVCRKVFEITGNKVEYLLLPDDTQLNAGMNSTLIYKTLGWKPVYSFAETVEDTVKFIMSEE